MKKRRGSRRTSGNEEFAIPCSLFLATHIGMIACVVSDRVKTKHIAEVFGVYVSAHYRGQGVGTRLLEHSLRSIRRKGRVIKVKPAVNPEQPAAVRLYKKAGFVVTGRARKELKVGRNFFDMLYMEKLL